MKAPARRLVAAIFAACVLATSAIAVISSPALGDDPTECLASPVSTLKSMLSSSLGDSKDRAVSACPPEPGTTLVASPTPLRTSPAEAVKAEQDDVEAQAVDVELITSARLYGAAGVTGVSDIAIVIKPNPDGPQPGGTVTFELYSGNDFLCNGKIYATSTVPFTGFVTDRAVASSEEVILDEPGFYRWRASYSGDANYNPVTAPCNEPDESTYIYEPSDSLILLSDAGTDVAEVGQPKHDVAFFRKPSPSSPEPTGTVSFALYGPVDATCSEAPIFTSADRPLNFEAAATSANYMPTSPGEYRWIATYSGDENYDPISAPCNAPHENFVVPGLITEVSDPTITLGDSVYDELVYAQFQTQAGFVSGDVSFEAYGPDDATCSGEPVFTSPGSDAGETRRSSLFTPTEVGTYRFIAAYGGSGSLPALRGDCNDPGETVVVTDGGGSGGSSDGDDGSSDDDDGDDGSSSDDDDGDGSSSDDGDGSSRGSDLPDTGGSPASALAFGFAILAAGMILVQSVRFGRTHAN